MKYKTNKGTLIDVLYPVGGGCVMVDATTQRNGVIRTTMQASAIIGYKLIEKDDTNGNDTERKEK